MARTIRRAKLSSVQTKLKTAPLHVFISYSYRDKSEVDRIVQRLTREGHDVWIDRLNLQPGDNMQEKIKQGLQEADVLVIVISENSFRSEWIQHEFSTIVLQNQISGRDRRIIPIRLDQVSVPNYLADLVYLDFSQDFEAGLDRLSSELKVHTARTAVHSGDLASINEGQDTQIRKLRDALQKGRLTLVCGAGVSVGAGIPPWKDLLIRLLDRMLERLHETESVSIDRKIAADFRTAYGNSSALILGKYLKNNLGDDFPKETRDALYVYTTETSALIESIVNLSRPQRDAKPLDSIITFNFDCIIEENLDRNYIPNKPIFSESTRHDTNQLPIYHVHGYLPRSNPIPNTELVFSEDAYHSQFIDAFSWSNLIQLSKLTQNTCLFIGISLTDPNMRRLLDVAWRKNPDKTRSHFIVKKQSDASKNAALAKVSRLLEEQDANTLGLNLVWIENFDELPVFLNKIAASV